MPTEANGSVTIALVIQTLNRGRKMIRNRRKLMDKFIMCEVIRGKITELENMSMANSYKVYLRIKQLKRQLEALENEKNN